MDDIRMLVWDQKNLRHVFDKGIDITDLEGAIFSGKWELRRGKVVKRGENVVQRYYLIAKAPSGNRYKVVLEPVGRQERSWRCITAWMTK